MFNRKPAPVIAILGPDGAGKTTVANKLHESLKRSGHESQIAELGVYNGRTLFLKTLKDIRNSLLSVKSDNIPTFESSGSKTIGDRRSPISAVIHFIDIGIRVGRVRAGSEVVIADRYAHEIVLYDNPGIFRRLFSWFERPPFYGVILVGPANEVAARSEYDPESIATMYDRLNELEYDTIDCTQPPDVIVDQILSYISETDILIGDSISNT